MRTEGADASPIALSPPGYPDLLGAFPNPGCEAPTKGVTAWHGIATPLGDPHHIENSTARGSTARRLYERWLCGREPQTKGAQPGR